VATYLYQLTGRIHRLRNIPIPILTDIVHWLAEQPFETSVDRRNLLAVFDKILDASSAKDSLQFKTPYNIARLMAELAAPTSGDSIYDPCFGSAGLLTASIDYVLHNEKQKNARYFSASLKISGMELIPSVYIIGMTRLVLAGFDDPQLECGNSLERIPLDNPQREGFDVVLANPPWGGKVKMDNRYGLEQYPVMTTDSTGLFIQHALSNLRPDGRAVIVVPNGILFRQGPERRLREWLVRQHTIESVISLPETAFLPYTAIKSCILVLRRGGTTKQIRMADAEPLFERGKGKQPATISDNQITVLIDIIRNAKSSEYCWNVDAETLADTEFDLTPRRRDHSGLISLLDSLPPSVKLMQLKECCQIISGRPPVLTVNLLDGVQHVRDMMTGQLHNANQVGNIYKDRINNKVAEIPVIRIKDINKGRVDKGSAWIFADVMTDIESSRKLRGGDVLLSKSGTIGKVGIVTNGAVGAVPASGLFVLRVNNELIDPHFLSDYLDSAECRAWLKDRSSGAVINHLSKRIIEDMPVPLPPLQIQHLVSSEWREHGADALAYLLHLLTNDGRDPIDEWVTKELRNLPGDVSSIKTPLDFTSLEQILDRILYIRNEIVHGKYGENILVSWLLAFNEAIFPLKGISEMPHGPGLLSVLQVSVQKLKGAESAIKGRLPNESRAHTLTDIVSKWLTQASSTLLNKVQIAFSIEDNTLRAGEVRELDLKAQNYSPLPLREIGIAFDPDWGFGGFKYLAEGASEIIGLQAVVPKTIGPLMLNIRWSAVTLDGQDVDGKTEIAFEVLSDVIDAPRAMVELGSSPYVCGDPIRPERNDVFFGRDELLAQIRRQIVKSGNVVLLEGNRRAGKSSILRHLEGLGPVPDWLGVYCSLQGAEGSREKVGVPTAAVFREIASSLAKGMVTLGIELPLPDGSILPAGKKIGIAGACRKGISEEAPFTDFRDYAEVVLDTVSKHKLGILLMLDEFDKLQEGIDNKVTSPQVPENIRYMVQTYPNFSAILTGSRRMKRLREEYWSALYGLGTRFDVTSLSHEAASRLVTEPVKGRLTYSRESMERAISITNHQPYLLQCLCNRIFDMAAQLKIRSVTLDIVEQAGNLLADNNEHFASLWDYAGSDRRRFILGIIYKEEADSNFLHFGTLKERLSSYGIELNDENLIADIEFLRELELVDLKGEICSGHYVLSIPLMGRWIDRQHDFEVLMKKAQMETEDHND
jgi:type I restriction enzyme M protein